MIFIDWISVYQDIHYTAENFFNTLENVFLFVPLTVLASGHLTFY